MDLNTVQQTLVIAQKHMTPENYQLFLKDMRIAYVESRIQAATAYIEPRKKVCPVPELSRLTRAKLIVQECEQQLAALRQ